MDYSQRKQSQAAQDEYSQSISATDPLHEIKTDLEGWREVLLPLASVLRWDKPFYPAITAGVVTFIFLVIWLTGMSTVTTVSLILMIVGIVDFLVPFLGPKITGQKPWTGVEESAFSQICEQIVNLQQGIVDTYLGLSAMRRQNPKLFFFVVMGSLTVTAWIGNLLDNLLLTYFLVVFILLLPGIRHNNIATKYFQPLLNILLKLRQGAQNKQKEN